MSREAEIVAWLRSEFPTDATRLSEAERLAEVERVFSEEVAWPDFEVAMVAPGGWGSERRGARGYAESWSDWLQPFEAFRIEFGDVLEGADGVVQLVRQIGVPAGSVAEVESESAAVFRFRDGRISRIEFHLSRDDAMRAAGLGSAS